MEKIFVYGSLRKDFWNHDKVLKNRVKHIESGCIKGFSLYHLPAGYPAIISGNDIVHGEICTLSNDKHLKSIDLLEGYTGNSEKDLYIRKKKPVLLSTGKEELCWVYLYINEKHVRNKGKYIAHGDWKKYMFHNASYK